MKPGLVWWKPATDFDYCERYLKSHCFGKYHTLKTYYVNQHRSRAIVALAEVEFDLALPEEAKNHVDEGEKSLSFVAGYIKSNNLKVKDNTVLDLKHRLEDLRSRLKGVQGTRPRRERLRRPLAGAACYG